jgi:transglutaminase-like putative cysteine protease
LFNLLAAHREVVMRATSFVQTHRRPAVDRLAGVDAPGAGEIHFDALEYLPPSPLAAGNGEVTAFISGLGRFQGPLVELVERLFAAVRGRLAYEKKVTAADTPVEAALKLGRGVCQDFTHLFLAGARGLGLPARYVSGYINEPGEIATHAWAQIWGGPAIGWVDVDPTRGTWVGDDHVVTAVGRDYSDVPPNRGVWKGRASEAISVTVQVQPVDRLPPEATEPAVSVPAWSQVQQQVRGRPRMQQEARHYRQQQSQQQQ